MSTELTLLAWTVVLGIVQLLIAAQFFTAAHGLHYGLTARDEPPPGEMSAVGKRWKRAFDNLLETFPFAAAAILIAAVAGRSNAWTWWGAQLYFWGRVAYAPVYGAGIYGLRTAIWAVSMLGILLVLLGLVWS